MGFTPRQVDDMSLWEFRACVRGYNAAQGGDPLAEPMSDERAAELGIEGFDGC